MTNRLQGALPKASKRVLGRRARTLAATTFLAFALPVSFVAAPVLAQSYAFQKVVIEGNERVEPETILGFAAIAKGQTLGAGALNDAYQRLQGSGLFETVELVPRGNTLVIKVAEYPTVNIVDFEGNKILKDEVLTTLVKTQPRRVFSPALVEADAAAMAEGYAEAGRLNVRIDPKVIKRAGNRVDVVFEIKEGAVSEVNRIRFTGNRAYSDRRLRDVLGTKQAGILHRLIQRDTFVADRIALDRQMLIDFYRSRGYPDVEVAGVSSEMTRDRESFFMTFNIREGQQYHFGKTGVVSEVSELEAADFEKLVKIREGAIYSPAAIDYAVTRIEEVALREGANFVRVDPRITRDPRTQTLNVEFALVRGPRVFVERIDIEGNTTTLDSVIRREFNAVEGDPFNPREIKNSAERIRALGFFSNADVEARQGSGSDQVVVDVNVEEQPTGSLSFGASYGASQGFGVSAALEESNFLGRGQYLGVSIGTTADNQQNSIDFMEPHLLGRDLQGRIRLWYNTSEDDNSDFDTKMMGISPSIEFPITRNARLALRYTWERNELSGVTSLAEALADSTIDDNYYSSPILVAEQGARDSSSIGYTYTFDTRRTGIDPRYGFTFRLSQDIYGLGGDVEALKTTALLRAERKLFHEDVTVRAELEGGAIAARGGTALTVLDRFSGSGKVRGFETWGYGPRDFDPTFAGRSNEDALGGKYFAALRLESEFPVGLPEEYGIHGGVFFDVGSLWGLDNTAGSFGTVDDGMHVRSSVGLSVFWDSALGPLRLNFSKALKKEDYDLEQSFDLTLSTSF
ncbi:outer membrane protein assembly factor BamA [Rhodobacter sp. TJ_12]|uniref:outer membrane protein assembly factor BamA n=1 Tax=Rhodobacter sp. TJ_12 TaxID=2029399 RepID=UPI001CBC2220|nr:outer membrane protein assembly factor BamA [Rhodobacter sp. TJ_12]MBZ4021583.1 outer membrane protein assembly factor BamA [Rhodobacter sp. TJ_12]